MRSGAPRRGIAWYPDLGTTCQIAMAACVRAIGWLSAEHEFAKGTVAPPALDALRVLIRDGYVPVALGGPHVCELCSNAREANNVVVPAGDLLYVAPAMVAHYVEAHEYAAPLRLAEKRAAREAAASQKTGIHW